MGPAFTLPLRCVLALALAGQADESAAPRFEVSPGPFERTWGLVDPASAPRLPDGLPLGELDSNEVWLAWAAHVRSAGSGTPAERARSRLWAATFAARQGRHDDAWDHLAHAGEDPAGLLAVLPLLAPGVAPADLAAWPALPDGAELAPALPPPSVALARILLGTGRVRAGTLEVSDFRIGQARVALLLTVEGDGVQIDLQHLGGGAARLRLRPPVPPDFRLGSLNLDWEQVPGEVAELDLELQPEAEDRLIYGRYRPQRIAWPTTTPEDLPAQARRDGLCLWVAPEAPAEGLRAGLSELLGLRVRQQLGGAEAPRAGLVLDLRDARSRPDKLFALVSQAERYVLGGTR